MYFRGIVTELLWFLRGDTNIKYLVDNDCNIWTGDAYKNYLKNWKPQPVIENELHWMEQELVNDRPLPKDMFIHCIKKDAEFAKTWGDLGPIYGKQWRSWETGFDAFERTEYKSIDQIANSINLLKTDPDSRRNRVSAWNVGELDEMTLPPCHTDFQFYTRELRSEERVDYFNSKMIKEGIRTQIATVGVDESYLKKALEETNHNIPTRAISLMFNMRSNDVPLGLPFNIASYALLLEIIGKMVNMLPDELITNLGDAHIYKNQIDGVKEQLARTPMKLPNLIISDELNFNGTIDDFLASYTKDSFKLNGYESHPTIKMPLSN
jgi:thymidylate synthase